MPIYEYHCLDCETRFELRRSFSEADIPTECTQCHGQHTQRAISNFFAISRSGDGGSTRSVGSSNCAGCTASSCVDCRR